MSNINKKRIGKDLAIQWEILTNGEETALAGRNLTLEVTDPYGSFQTLDFTSEGNVLYATFYASQQAYTGKHVFTLWENLNESGGQTAVDALALELVDRTYKESTPTESDVEVTSVELESSNLFVGVRGANATINGYNVVNLVGGAGTTVTTTASGSTATITITATNANADHATAVSDHTTAAADHATAVSDHAAAASKADQSYVDTELAKKQNTIADLDTIRSGAALGATAVQPETGKGLFSGNYNDLTNKPTNVSSFTNDAGYLVSDDISGKADKSELTTLGAQVSGHTGNTTVHITADERSSWNGKYSKPSTGVPKTDLAADVQTSLVKADTALQSLDAYGLSVANGMLCVTY